MSQRVAPGSIDWILLQTLAEHALWVHVEPGKQPSKCSCGQSFKPGDWMNAHIIEDVHKQLADAGYEIGPKSQ